MLYALGESQPVLSRRHFIAPDAVLIGNVTIGEDVSIWFNAVIRGDNAAIVIGEGGTGPSLHRDPGTGQRCTVDADETAFQGSQRCAAQGEEDGQQYGSGEGGHISPKV